MGLAVLSWGPFLPVAKRALPYVDAFTLGTLRYVLGTALFVLLLAAIEGRGALRYGGRLPAAAAVGVTGICGFNLFVWYGLNFTSPEHAAIILALQTPLTALALWAWRGQRPAGFTLACVALVAAGVVVVVTHGEPARALAGIGAGGALYGDFLVLLGAASWSFYALAASRFGGWSPLRYTVLTCIPALGGFFVFNALAVAADLAAIPPLGNVIAIGWHIAYFAVGAVVLGVLAFNSGVQHLGPLNGMLVLNLVPVSVFAIEAALGRVFGPLELGGAALVIGALVANNLYLRRAATARAAA